MCANANNNVVIRTTTHYQSSRFRIRIRNRQPINKRLMNHISKNSPKIISTSSRLNHRRTRVIITQHKRILITPHNFSHMNIPKRRTHHRITITTLNSTRSITLSINNFRPTSILVTTNFLRRRVQYHTHL